MACLALSVDIRGSPAERIYQQLDLQSLPEAEAEAGEAGIGNFAGFTRFLKKINQYIFPF